MKSHHVAILAGGAAVVGGGAWIYFYKKAKAAQPGYYPGGQGIPGRAPNGAPQNFSGQKGNDAAQIIGASTAGLAAVLPKIGDLFSGGDEPTALEPTGSTQGLPSIDDDPNFFT